ncbi:MAG: LicD family protein [Actinomycetota bacterium]|nr:LicD family protein [Actinomycetota bacterium]
MTTAGVDDDGLHLAVEDDVVLDVAFDGRRVWSFSSGEHPVAADGLRHVSWPVPLRRRLVGRTTLSVLEHSTGREILAVDRSFGGSDKPIRLVDAAGNPLAITKWGRLNRPFAHVDRAVLEGYLDQVEEVLSVLRDDCGLPAFLCYGSLLGAMRTGKFIGHDVDVDLGYLSAYHHPADVIREGFRVERVLRKQGYKVLWQNGGFLALFLPQIDGTSRNLDVFACFAVNGRLYQAHDVDTEGDESVFVPLGECQFEGRTMPVPARPEVLLEAAYGKDWRIPNPAFTFSKARRTRRRIYGWLGERRQRNDWNKLHSKSPAGGEASAFARWVVDREEAVGQVVDVGCGTGRDAVFFAAAGWRVLGLDFSRAALKKAATAAGRQQADADFRMCDLYSLRQSLVVGAQIARAPGPRLVYARRLFDDLRADGRDAFWRLAAMALRNGGRCYVEFAVSAKQAETAGKTQSVAGLKPNQVVREARAHGATVVHRELVSGPRPSGGGRSGVCRLGLEWSR